MSRRRAGLGVLVMLVLAGCGGGGSAGSDAASIRQTFARFDRALVGRNAALACAQVTANYWRAALAQVSAELTQRGSSPLNTSDCRSGLAAVFKLEGSAKPPAGVASFGLIDIAVHGATATATETHGGSKGPTDFVRVRGAWKIDCCVGAQVAQQPTATYRVPSGSMLPTLQIGQIVTSNNAALRAHGPALGDIVVLHPPAGADSATPLCGAAKEGAGFRRPCGVPTAHESAETFLKRIVGLPGDRIAVVGGHVVRNGVRQAEPYITSCTSGEPICTFPDPIVVPAGEYYVLGDNRPASDDSRFWGPVKRAWIIGLIQR